MLASILLARSFSRRVVFLAASSALVAQTVISVLIGKTLSIFFGSYMRYISTAIMAVAALYLIKEALTNADDGPGTIAKVTSKIRIRAAFPFTFLVIFLAEIGDITQIATISLSSRYSQPLSVGVGASIGLIGAVAVAMGVSGLLNRVEEKPLQLIAALGLVLASVITLL